MAELKRKAKTFWCWHNFWWNAIKFTKSVILHGIHNVGLETSPAPTITWSRMETFWGHAWCFPGIHSSLIHCFYLLPDFSKLFSNFYFEWLSHRLHDKGSQPAEIADGTVHASLFFSAYMIKLYFIKWVFS